jgi:hypothetical protein
MTSAWHDCICWAGQGLSHWIQLLEVYFIRTVFTLNETVFLVKVFRLFKLEQIVLVFSVWTQ